MTEIKVLEWEWLQKIRIVFARILFFHAYFIVQNSALARRPCLDLEKMSRWPKKDRMLDTKGQIFCLFDFVQKNGRGKERDWLTAKKSRFLKIFVFFS